MTGESTPKLVRRQKQPRVPADFADMLRRIREEKGLTQQQMGELLGMPAKDAQSNYGKWERGDHKPTDIYVLRQMEHILGQVPGTLVDAALGPGAYALPEALRDNLRTLTPQQLDLMTEVAIGLHAIDKDPASPEISDAVREFIMNVSRKKHMNR